MGATQSAQPSPEELDNLALYPDEVVAALRACFGALATEDPDGFYLLRWTSVPYTRCRRTSSSPTSRL